MREGEIALIAIPQIDRQVKIRPVLILRELPPPYRDLLVCGISSQLHQAIEEFDDTILNTDDDFVKSGLTRESVIRLSFLGVIPRDRIPGKLV